MQLRAKDYELICGALLVWSKNEHATRGESERARKLASHFGALYRAAKGEEEVRRDQREQVTERRSARHMPEVSRQEADTWHAFLKPHRGLPVTARRGQTARP
jgi:hypothetical protein